MIEYKKLMEEKFTIVQNIKKQRENRGDNKMIKLKNIFRNKNKKNDYEAMEIYQRLEYRR